MTLKTACYCGTKAFDTEDAAQLHRDRMEARGLSTELPTSVRECGMGVWHLVYDRQPHYLRHRSAKLEEIYRKERRPLVERLLQERPVCERCRKARSTDVHEPRMRSRGADITDPEQCVCLCGHCHSFVHEHPAQATEEGWMVPSWDR